MVAMSRGRKGSCEVLAGVGAWNALMSRIDLSDSSILEGHPLLPALANTCSQVQTALHLDSSSSKWADRRQDKHVLSPAAPQSLSHRETEQKRHSRHHQFVSAAGDLPQKLLLRAFRISMAGPNASEPARPRMLDQFRHILEFRRLTRCDLIAPGETL